MPSVSWDKEDDHNRVRDSSGFTNDGLGGHTGRDTLQRGYEYGSLTRGCILYAPFDGSVQNTAPTPYSLTDNTSAGFNGSGQVGSDAKDFDGTDDGVDISSSIIGNAPRWTVSFWMKKSSAESTPCAYGEDDGGAKPFYIIYAGDSNDNNSVNVLLDDGTTTINIAGTTDVTDGNWHFVRVTYDDDADTTTRLFIDETQEASSTANVTQNSVSSTKMGRNGYGEYYTGLLDDVRAYTRPLSSPEGNALSNLTSTQTVVDGDVL